MKKVIITGADGFIGINLVKKFVEKNIEVWAIIYPKSITKNRIQNIDGVHCIECEIENLIDKIDKFPKEADVLYHLAWQGVDAKTRNDLKLQMNNINLCIKCMEFASAVNVKKFILPGSTSEYLYYGKPINELAIPSPQNAYGSVKIALRYLAEQYANSFKFDFIYVVITGIYAVDRRDNNVISYVIESLLNEEKPSLTQLEQLWDYINIKDVVEALLLVGDKGKANSFYAIGNGDNQPLYQYIDIIHKYINPELPLGLGEIPYSNEKLPSSCIDLTAIYKDTGFMPQIKFEDGIKEVIDRWRAEKT